MYGRHPYNIRRKYRDETKWKRNVRKKQRNSGQEYTNAKGKVIESKKFDSSDCSITRECHRLVVLDHREKLFSAFYSLANFDLQTSYLCGGIKLSKKVKHNESRRVYTRTYYLPDERGCEIPVCKAFFKKVLKVSDGRLSRALKGLQDNGVPSTDKRGKKAPYNKTSPAKVEEIKAFIERFPKYQSHYSRQKNQNKQYLATTLNTCISILYNLYKNEHENFVSKQVFTEVLKKNFNLSFHAPISDSCKTCDTLEQKIKYTADGDERRRLEIEREVHLRKTEAARVSMKSDAEFAKDVSNDLTVIAFDLMSTLPTPHLSTGVCYYKRQL
nr:unnamed protein product [Callosobruchus analis]